jgi:hypothetical protein
MGSAAFLACLTRLDHVCANFDCSSAGLFDDITTLLQRAILRGTDYPSRHGHPTQARDPPAAKSAEIPSQPGQGMHGIAVVVGAVLSYKLVCQLRSMRFGRCPALRRDILAKRAVPGVTIRCLMRVLSSHCSYLMSEEFNADAEDPVRIVPYGGPLRRGCSAWMSCVQDAAEERLLETVNAMVERRLSRTSGVLRVLLAP